GLSQPAMSHALRRLREMLNDQILVRNGSRMEPTQTALRLAPKVRNILAESFELVRGEQVFQPSSCERTFRIGMTDYVSSVILPKLTAEIYRLAPRAKLVVR